MARRRFTRSTRTLAWRNGSRNVRIDLTAGVGAPGVQVNSTLLTPITQGEHITLTRVVGTCHVVPDFTDVTNHAEGATIIAVNVGIQVVNRAAGAVGTARSPATADDREGREWIWMMTYLLGWTVTPSAGVPAGVYIPMHVEKGVNPAAVDIRVQRKIDDSQDELVFSAQATAVKGLSRDVVIVNNFRILIRNS